MKTFLDMAKQAGERCTAMYNSFSGTDVAEAELYRLERCTWLYLNEGHSIELALSRFDADWRKYAAENNVKVAAAGKLKRGPRSGQSVIEHRWVSPDMAESKAIHIRAMVKGMKRGVFNQELKVIVPTEK